METVKDRFQQMIDEIIAETIKPKIDDLPMILKTMIDVESLVNTKVSELLEQDEEQIKTTISKVREICNYILGDNNE